MTVGGAMPSEVKIGCPYCVGGTQRGGRVAIACLVCDGTGLLPKPTVVAEEHQRAWRIPTDDGADYGVLVEMKHVKADRRHWYLICPATATLYMDEPDGSFDLTDCCDGEACDFLDDTHAKAHLLVQQIMALVPPHPPVSGPET